MRIGYVRVSSKDQNETRQIESIQEFGVDKIYTDKQSGKDFNRTEYQRMISELHEGDVVVLHSLDRLGRNYDGIIEEWHRITKTIKADIIVLDMPLLNTTVNAQNLTGQFISDLVLQVLSYVAAQERENIRKRQAEGIAIAKAQGKYKGGKKKQIDSSIYEIAKAAYDLGEITKKAFADMCGITQPTLNRIIREGQA